MSEQYVFLRSLGAGDKWDSEIYPGMKQALVHVLQVTQDAIEYRKVSHGWDCLGPGYIYTYAVELECVNQYCSRKCGCATA